MANPSNAFPSSPPKVFDDGAGSVFFQPKNMTVVTTGVVTTAATNTTPFGFTTAAQANAIVAAVNAMYTALQSAGIVTTTTATVGI
jgi:hypothetical protein